MRKEKQRHGFLPCVGLDLRLVDRLGYVIGGKRAGQQRIIRVSARQCRPPVTGFYQDFRCIRPSDPGVRPGWREEGARSPPRMAEEDCIIVGDGRDSEAEPGAVYL